jgi:hypothetical protein
MLQSALGDHTGVASPARWDARLRGVSTITREQLLAFMREELYAVQASMSASSTPQAAIVGVIVSDRFEVFFDTLGTSREGGQPPSQPRGGSRHWPRSRRLDAYGQLEGVTDEPEGADLGRLLRDR